MMEQGMTSAVSGKSRRLGRYCRTGVLLVLVFVLSLPSLVDAAVSGKKFRKACASGNVSRVSKFLKKRPSAEVLSSGLSSAIYFGHDAVVSLLLDQIEPDPEHIRTAISHSRPDMALLLLDSGIDPSWQFTVTGVRGREIERGYEYEKFEDTRGWTLLALAVSKQSLNVVEALLNRGANPDVLVTSKPGQSTSSLNFSTVAVGGKMTVHGPGSHGYTEPTLTTALILAVENADQEIVEALVGGGANLDITDSSGKTACDVAQLQNEASIRELVCNNPEDSS
jgi:ankyrin repeat protein